MENPILPRGQAQEDHGYHLGTMFTESVIEAEFKIWSESSMTGGFGFYFLATLRCIRDLSAPTTDQTCAPISGSVAS